jgi:predicted MFS family arabinose efflux permease
MNVRHYAVVTAAYWAFTLTDGALRLLVLLHFHQLGYTPIQLATLFLLYEFFGIVTNFVGGWLAARTGVRATLIGGMALQVAALLMLAALDQAWLRVWSVAYVMACQALSGIAKDLTKMSAKSAIKALVPAGDRGGLFKWVAVLTGSKNALKGVGFFVGGFLLSTAGFRPALGIMAGVLAVILVGVLLMLPAGVGRPQKKPAFTAVMSTSAGINRLSAARVFLFAGRDVWFVVGVPVFLATALSWDFMRVGGFLALWVIGYGVIQGFAPMMLRGTIGSSAPGRRVAGSLGLLLAGVTALMPVALRAGWPPDGVILAGLAIFGIVFALNSSVHSYLVLAYATTDRVSMDVGFYYMANAAGRLFGTLLSGMTYQWGGLPAALWTAAALGLLAGVVGLTLPTVQMHVGAAVAGDE